MPDEVDISALSFVAAQTDSTVCKEWPYTFHLGLSIASATALKFLNAFFGEQNKYLNLIRRQINFGLIASNVSIQIASLKIVL